MTEKEFTPTQHILVPEHAKLSTEEKEQLLKSLNVSLKQLPKILKTDAAIKHLDPKKDDVIKILRNSPTAGKSAFYRVVV